MAARQPRAMVLGVTGGLSLALAVRSVERLPAWADNRAFLLTLLADHPESYRAQQSAAAVLAGIGDRAGARRAFATADSLFGGDPHCKAEYAFFVLGQGDTAIAARLSRAARAILARERVALRVDFGLERLRGHPARAAAIADTAVRWFPSERPWYGAISP